jgi:hypothetical protein
VVDGDTGLALDLFREPVGKSVIRLLGILIPADFMSTVERCGLKAGPVVGGIVEKNDTPLMGESDESSSDDSSSSDSIDDVEESESVEYVEDDFKERSLRLTLLRDERDDTEERGEGGDEGGEEVAMTLGIMSGSARG